MDMNFGIDDIVESDDDSQSRIVSFELSKNMAVVNVSECCDNYFDANLSKHEVGKLIARLQEFHVAMVEQ